MSKIIFDKSLDYEVQVLAFYLWGKQLSKASIDKYFGAEAWNIRVRSISTICRYLRSTIPFCLGVYAQDKKCNMPQFSVCLTKSILTNSPPPSNWNFFFLKKMVFYHFLKLQKTKEEVIYIFFCSGSNRVYLVRSSTNAT